MASWFAGVSDADLFVSVVVTGEIRQGIERLRRRDSRQAEILERWLEDVVTSYADRVLPIDGRVADAWGRLSPVRPIPVIDGLLAATARVHDMTLVTPQHPGRRRSRRPRAESLRRVMRKMAGRKTPRTPRVTTAHPPRRRDAGRP